jgi:hypothetical protein
MNMCLYRLARGKKILNDFQNTMFKFARTADNYEAITFIIYFSLKYEFDLPELSVKYAKEKKQLPAKMLYMAVL